MPVTRSGDRGAAQAASLATQNMQNVTAPAAATQSSSAEAAPVHYQLQYHYDRWDDYVPGWVAVPNSVR